MPSGPKSNKFTNRHAAEARERTEERRANEQQSKAKAREDAKWEETDAKVIKRQEKQREADQKAREQAERQAERRGQLEQEEKELSKKVPEKVSRRQIQKEMSKMLRDYDKDKQRERQQQSGAVVDAESAPLPTNNPNRAAAGSSTAHEEIKASGGVCNALAAMQTGMGNNGDGEMGPDDRNIGKRARVLYRKFCDAQLPTVKEEHPGMRRTQYNDILWKMWLKSPENPFVQRSEQRSKELLEQERRWMEAEDDDNDDENNDVKEIKNN